MGSSDIVVVIGGTGFIGQELVHQLRSSGQPLRVVSRRADVARSSAPGIEYISADIRDRAALAEIVRGATIVHHLAREDDDNFVTGVEFIAETCLMHGVRRLIFASSSDALYLGDRGTLAADTGPDPRSNLRNQYSRSKAEAEALLMRMHRDNGLPVVITRPCLVVGRGGRISHGGLGRWPAPTCCVGFSDGNNPLPFVLVQDVADAHVRAMDAEGIDGLAFNLAGDVFLSAREYVSILAEQSMRNFRYFPRSVVGTFLTENAKALIKRVVSQHPEPRPTYREFRSSAMFTCIDNSLAKQRLGWRPNADLNVFIREAIEANLEPVPRGDLRIKALPSTTGGQTVARW
jgi:nucleoside-diphosphate-sugar epimerase